ncbi:MAG: F0F1 ATP synthase subunit B [Candidatus Omnitrophota bacterium]
MDNKQILSEIVVQILGFLLVFWLLRTFAWTKLLGMIDARRKKIEEGFQDIDARKGSLDQLELDYRRKLEHIEQEARTKIQEAGKRGSELSKDIQDKARHEAQQMVQRAKEEIERELLKAKLSMRNEIVEISSLMTEKILKEKLDAASHQKLVDQFIREMEKV